MNKNSMKEKIKGIISNFQFNGELVNIEENNQGNINSTYILSFDENGIVKKFMLQKINANVFKEPYLVMKNIELVTKYINQKLKEENIKHYKSLKFVDVKTGGLLCSYTNENGEKEYYRAYSYIEDCYSYDSYRDCKSPNSVVYNAGKCLGFFHKLLIEFPTNLLSETIPNFHNTPKRFEDLLKSIENNVTNRAYEFSKEIIELISKSKECSYIHDNLGVSIPIRVTHNDTKLNNMLIDANTDKGISMIDLDTTMPGTVLFDIGDGVRTTCSTAAEDEKDLNQVSLNLEITEEYIKGYLLETKKYLTKQEIENIPIAIKIITYEQCLRFLTDYINGDTYFKIKYPEHNKVRFLNQITLLRDIENKMGQLEEIVEKYK